MRIKSLINTLQRGKFLFSDSTRLQQIRSHPPLTEFQNLNPKITKHLPTQFKILTDKETGIRFLIEEGGFPSCADLGICLKLGVQDQSPEESGSLNYLKSFVFMKPTMQELVSNYQFLQQTGSFFDLNFDPFLTYAKCSFLQQDKSIMIDILLDLVLREKNMFEDNFQNPKDLSNISQLVRRTAFKGSPLGMPLQGDGNVLRNADFLSYQRKIAPSNMLISLANIKQPQESMKIIIQKIKQRYPSFLTRIPPITKKSIYKGGLGTFVNPQSQFFEFALSYPSASLSSSNMEVFNILRVLLGSASSFSSGGPGKGMHSRCTKYLLNRVACVEKASFINEHYEDHGLFGLTVGGPHDTFQDVIKCTIEQMKRLKHKIPEEQLNRAKNILISSLYTNTQRQSDRLDEMSKNIFSYGKVRLYEFEKKIRQITTDRIQKVIQEMMKGKPTFVYVGLEETIKSAPKEQQLLKNIASK